MAIKSCRSFPRRAGHGPRMEPITLDARTAPVNPAANGDESASAKADTHSSSIHGRKSRRGRKSRHPLLLLNPLALESTPTGRDAKADTRKSRHPLFNPPQPHRKSRHPLSLESTPTAIREFQGIRRTLARGDGTKADTHFPIRSGRQPWVMGSEPNAYRERRFGPAEGEGSDGNGSGRNPLTPTVRRERRAAWVNGSVETARLGMTLSVPMSDRRWARV